MFGLKRTPARRKATTNWVLTGAGDYCAGSRRRSDRVSVRQSVGAECVSSSQGRHSPCLASLLMAASDPGSTAAPTHRETAPASAVVQPLSGVHQPPGATHCLWRFMDFTKYVAMLDQRGLFFTRADRFADPFEGSFARPNLVERRTTMQTARPQLRQSILLNCWHCNEHESAGMWRIYLTGPNGVAVQSRVSALMRCFPAELGRLYIGRVHYLDYAVERIPSAPELAPFFCKRKSFEHEQEVRLAYRSEAPLAEAGRYLDSRLEQLVERVVVCPTAEPWFAELVRSVTRKYGFELPVACSEIDAPPYDRRSEIVPG